MNTRLGIRFFAPLCGLALVLGGCAGRGFSASDADHWWADLMRPSGTSSSSISSVEHSWSESARVRRWRRSGSMIDAEQRFSERMEPRAAALSMASLDGKLQENENLRRLTNDLSAVNLEKRFSESMRGE